MACAIGALIVAVWFALGREGAQNRRWWLPMLAVGLVPIAIGCAISSVKFGQLFGFNLSDQIASGFFQTRNYKNFSISYVPTALHAYLQPTGLQLGDVFPYITMPPEVQASSNIITDPTASLPTSMPLLFILGVWGTVCAVRPRPAGRLSAIRLVLLAAAVGGGTLLIFGWILERYLADFLPFLILASAVGLVDLWWRFEHRRRRTQALVLAVLSLLGILSIAANFGIAISPSPTWSTVQARNYVKFQKSISDVTGHPLAAHVMQGGRLPISWAPRDQLFVVGDCSALYISNGLGRKGTLTLGANWLLVEKAPNRSLCLNITGDR